MNQDNLFDQLVNISKASAFDAIKDDYSKVKAENEKLRNRVKYLEDLIEEYVIKMKANLSGYKVQSFLKEQIRDSDTEKEIIQEMKDHDDLKDINI